MLISRNRENLQSLTANKSLWQSNSTFKITPYLILLAVYRIYSDWRFLPSLYIYALLNNKRENSDRKLLVGLSKLTGSVAPHKILLDFETAAINMFAEQYPTREIKDCYSHHCQFQ